jgi:hypothetical protein
MLENRQNVLSQAAFRKFFSTGSGFQSAFSGSKNAALEGFL